MKVCTNLSRSEAIATKHPANSALISITDADSPPAVLHEPAWLDILRLRFDDINMAEEDAKDSDVLVDYVLPNKRIAAEIVTFIYRHSEQNIAVHCEQGISRSAAVCRLLKELGWNYRCPPTRPFGHQHANTALVRLLHDEVVARFGTNSISEVVR
jgi:predicted protein tyrosine phosphatase